MGNTKENQLEISKRRTHNSPYGLFIGLMEHYKKAEKG